MAKGKNDLILRDRLQFTFDSNGAVATLYGRVDLSDYVSIPKSEGLKIKEIRFQLRDPTTANTGVFGYGLVLTRLQVEKITGKLMLGRLDDLIGNQISEKEHDKAYPPTLRQ